MNENEIRAVLKHGVLTEQESEEAVSHALAAAGDPAPSSATWRRPLVIAAVLFLAGVGIWRGTRRGDPVHFGDDATDNVPPVAHDVAGETVKQRARNQAYFDSREGQAALAAVPDGAWVVIHKARLYSGPDLATVLRKRGSGYHRFVFRKGQEGARAYEATSLDAPWAGTAFLTEAKLEINGRLREMFPSPDGRPWLPVVRGLRVVLSTDSVCPLLVPQFRTSTMLEIPGSASVKAIGREWKKLTRRLVRVRIKKLGIDGYFEAVEVPGLGDKTVADRRWKYIDDVARAIGRARGAKEPYVTIVGKCPDWLDTVLGDCGELLDGPRLSYSPFGATPGKNELCVVVKQRVGVLALDKDTKPEAVRAWLAKQLAR